MKPAVWLLAVVLGLSACGREEQPPPPDQRARMESLRHELRQTLGAKYTEPVPPATVAQLKRGSELFAELCAPCHGARGDGKVEHPGVLLQQPSNFTDPAQATFFSEQARLHIIRKGIPGTAMMGWEGVLPEDDIVAIYQYVRHLYQSR
ncbi:MAG: cytochrome c [candidate division KSB1 bacterium]|nr:cytochrome c [candidate division KSB1 bacterium]MDZ7276377.1 cytochrome c [candidate division KSB1 bacterium]MDZ7287671.1 cytochrome c [candidate division KSB1 bacterium]MDZ7299989.1 cytochrome c [candidate division KSB1 bacterium]MDZ7307342.1 cytochrome c [candidate division KSB1 bacterium]